MTTRQAPYVIFTDLDGTLLDQDSSSPRGAEPALERIQAHKVPLVFCTSQTRAEVETIRAELGNGDPFIVENGGAIFVPEGYFPFPVPGAKAGDGYEVIELGRPYAEVTTTLQRAANVTGCRIRAFHEMSPAQVALWRRVGLRAAEYAKQREYDEPFDVLSQSSSVIFSLFDWIERDGLNWARGVHCYHVHGNHNKGQAAGMLAALYRQCYAETITIGLGDGPNDISLLAVVDVPIVIPNRDTWPRSAGMAKGVAEYPGPRGWNRAVLQLLGRQDLRAASRI